MSKPGNTGLMRAFRAAKFSGQGLKQAWQHESAFRQEVTLLVVMIPLAIWLGRTLVEQALLIAVCLLVLLVELLNSAIEAAIDRQGSERHELSGRAKDMGSAAVSIALLIVVVVWSSVAIQRFA
ncbi:MAG: diacylglycerol kinase [Woeseiaceae bacterium]|nr:diacylglycerol kinase [Woeseiaceae bacterium]